MTKYYNEYKMETKVINYDKKKAKRNFVLFKLAELFGLFLFFFGFEKYGHLASKVYLILWPESVLPGTYFGWWGLGLVSMFFTLSLLGVCYIIIYGLYHLILGWLKLNWKWAQRSTEDSTSKIERLKEKEKLKLVKEIEEKERQRKEYGYCVGDIAISKKTCKSETRENLTKGKKYEIMQIRDDEGDLKIEEDDDGYSVWHKESYFKIIKKPLPKKPKLNKKYIKE